MQKYYTFDWASRTFEVFFQFYTQESQTLMDLLSVDKADVVHMVQCFQDKWNSFKKCAKYLHDNKKMIEEEWNSLSPKDTNYLSYVKYHRKYLQNLLWKGERCLDILLQRVLF